jgi:T5SS/PEP-CTERM-associated repeat protein
MTRMNLFDSAASRFQNASFLLGGPCPRQDCIFELSVMMRQRLIVACFVVAVCFLNVTASHAAISTTGDVAPSPPAGGGPVTGPFRVGNTDVGAMNIAGGTALTNSGEAIVGAQTNGIGIVTMSGFGSNWTLTTSGADLTVGAAGIGSVSLSELARMNVNDETILGSSVTGVGEIIISDLGTVWNSQEVVVGQLGRGAVNVSAGGRLISTTSTIGESGQSEGNVTISDPLSQWQVTGGVNVGSSGRGNLYLFDGGSLRTSIGSTVGNALGSVGTVEISGAGSLWNTVNGNLNLGSTGTGILRVLDGGRAHVGGLVQLASTTGSRGVLLVDGVNSVLSATGQLTTGVGEGEIIVSNGGIITTNGVQISQGGRLSLDGGRVESTSSSISNQGLVQGSGVIDVNTFNIQFSGNIPGRMRIEENQHLTFTGSLSNAGIIEIVGGELEVLSTSTNSFAIEASYGATLRFGGTGISNSSSLHGLSIIGGEVDLFGRVSNSSNSRIVVGNSSTAVFHDTLANNGDLVVLPGSSVFGVDALNLLGVGSNLAIELGADDAFETVAPLVAGGQIIVEGDLTVTLADGFEPELGDVFPLLFAGDQRSGIFSNENLPVLAAGLKWELEYTPNSASLTVVEGSDGDFDGDGDVDGRDFLIWQRGGSPNPRSASDLADWQANYGVAPVTSVSMAVPEPGNVLLMIGYATGIAFLRRQRDSRH